MQSNAKGLTARAGAALRQPQALTPLILLMGCIGAALRYTLEAALPAQGGFPAATLIINIFGCFVLELINSYIGRRMHLPGPLVKSLGVGLVGAFTTIAAFSTECLAFLQAGEYALWAGYVGMTIATTFLAALAGHGVCRLLDARRMKRMEARREAIHRRHAAAKAAAARAQKEKRDSSAHAPKSHKTESVARVAKPTEITPRTTSAAEAAQHANKQAAQTAQANEEACDAKAQDATNSRKLPSAKPNSNGGLR